MNVDDYSFGMILEKHLNGFLFLEIPNYWCPMMSRYFFLLEERFYYFDWIVDPLPFVSQLCTALETASKLVHSTNSLVRLLLEKVEELEGVVKRGDSAIAAAKAIHNSLTPGVGSVSSRNIEQPRL